MREKSNDCDLLVTQLQYMIPDVFQAIFIMYMYLYFSVIYFYEKILQTFIKTKFIENMFCDNAAFGANIVDFIPKPYMLINGQSYLSNLWLLNIQLKGTKYSMDN